VCTRIRGTGKRVLGWGLGDLGARRAVEVRVNACLTIERMFDTLVSPDRLIDSGSLSQITQGPTIHEMRER
jgi:hypothetical protein